MTLLNLNKMENNRRVIAGLITALIMGTTLVLFLVTVHLIKEKQKSIINSGVASKGDTLRGGFYYGE